RRRRSRRASPATAFLSTACFSWSPSCSCATGGLGQARSDASSGRGRARLGPQKRALHEQSDETERHQSHRGAYAREATDESHEREIEEESRREGDNRSEERRVGKEWRSRGARDE